MCIIIKHVRFHPTIKINYIRVKKPADIVEINKNRSDIL